MVKYRRNSILPKIKGIKVLVYLSKAFLLCIWAISLRTSQSVTIVFLEDSPNLPAPPKGEYASTDIPFYLNLQNQNDKGYIE